jgi:PASTA domain-containing protein
MALTKPALTNVNPGEPVTAQGWNSLVDGLGDLYDAVLAFRHGVLSVSVLADGNPVAGAVIVAAPAAGDLMPLQAVPLYGSVATYTVVGVTTGQWHVFVSAPGFQPQTQDVTIPATSPLVFNLVAAGVVVPDLFGVTAQDALSQLATLNLNVDVILDVMGHEVPKSSLPPQYQNQPILDQLPTAGTVVDPASQRVRLVVATALDQAPVVTMPSLVGLTYDEVASVLDGLGLKVGKTSVQS